MAAKQKPNQKQNQFQIFIRLFSLFLQGIMSVFGRSPLSKSTKIKRQKNNQKNNQNIRKIKAAKLGRSLFTSFLAFILTISFSSINLWFTLPAYAAGLYIEPLTWNFIGLDSNNVNVGPDTFLVGARVCNTSGSTLNNINVQFVRQGATNPYIAVKATGALPFTDTITIASLPSGSAPTVNHNNVPDTGSANVTPANCYNVYYDAVVTRTSAAYNTTQKFTIQATSTAGTVDTNSALGNGSIPGYNYGSSIQQELYVEKLLSQARNSVGSFSGPTTVYVGDVIEYTLVTSTAPQGYEQLTVSSNFPNAVFEFLDIKTTYSSDPIVNASIYQDGCGWIGDPANVGYHTAANACDGPVANQDSNGDGKIGGSNITTRYRVKILSTGAAGGGSNTIAVSHLINDFSGSSYHYNSDYGQGVGITYITILGAPDVRITKTAAAPFYTGVNGTYTLTVDNTTTASSTVGGMTVQDTLPSGVTFQSFTSALGTWTCKNALNNTCAAGDQGTLTFTTASELAGAASTTLTLTVKPTVAGSVTNNATVSTPRDSNPANNTSSVTTTVTALPDLTITKTGSTQVSQGGSATFTLTPQNIGLAATSGVITVTDTLPTGITPISASGTGWTCGAPSGQVISCTRSDVIAAATNAYTPKTFDAITVLANVSTTASAGTVQNQAAISGGGQQNTSNDTATLNVTIGSSPDLTITKGHSPTNFTAGSTATYTLNVSNIGNQSTSGTVTVTDVLPTGITYSSFTGTGWSCSASGQIVTCTRSDALATSASYPTITLTVSVASNAPSTLVNNASVYVSGDGNASNNSASDTANLATTPPELTINKVAIGTFVKATGATGPQAAQYAITVKNIGGTATSGTFYVEDAIVDANVNYVSASATGWTCTTGPVTGSTSGNITFRCNNGGTAQLSPGQSITIPVNVQITNGVGNSVVNRTQVTSTTTSVALTAFTGTAVNSEATTTNNYAAITTPTNGTAVSDLTITKTHTGNFQLGQTGATYTIAVQNIGGADSTGTITVVDTLPTGLSSGFSGTYTNNGWSCTNTNATTITCTTASPTTVIGYPGSTNSSSSSFTLPVNVSTSAASSVINSVTVSGGGQTNTANDTATDPTTIVAPDLKITKSGPSSINQGATLSYTLSVQNIGNAATTTAPIYVTDVLSSSFSSTGVTATGTGWTCTVTGLNVSCTRSSNDALAAAAYYPDITVKATVLSNATTAITNTALVTGTNVSDPTAPTVAGGETNTANNKATTVNTTINTVPDLTISKTGPASVTQGGTASYTLTVNNIGSSATSGTITVTDTLPTGLTANFTNPYTNNSWTCNATGQTITCTNSVVLVATTGTSSFVLPVNVSSSAPSFVTNNVSVAVGGEQNTSNNTATFTSTVTSVPDLTISKSHTGNFTQQQTGATYTLRVLNIGSASTNGTQIKITDTLPTGLTPTAASGTGWTCSVSGQLVTCDRTDVLASNFTAYPDITITVNVASNASSPLINSATVQGATANSLAGGETNITNNTATDSTTINTYVAPPDLKITKTHTGNFTQGQVGAAYTLTVQNVSATALTAGNVVTVTDTVPLDLKITAPSGTVNGWSCSINNANFGNTLTCTRSDALGVSPATYLTIPVTVTVATDARNEFSNFANVSTPPDINTANNFASDPTIVNQIDLSIIKTAPASLSQGQTGATYTLTVYNLGASSTNGTTVTVTDTVPSDLKITAPTGTINGWSCSLNNANFGNTITCTRSDVLLGDPTPGVLGANNSPYSGDEPSYLSIALTVDVSASATTVINIGQVSGGGDVNTSNNQYTVSTVVSIPSFNIIKRITAINGVDVNGFISVAASGLSNDSDAKWPSPNTTYLRGGTDCTVTSGATTCDGIKGAKPTDLVEYTIYFLANGNENLKNSQICDAIPANTTFEPNTYGTGNGILLGWDSTGANLPNPDATVGTGEVALTNASSFLAINASDTNAPAPCNASVPRGAVLVKFGTSPVIRYATSSGTPKSSYGFVRFKVKVN